MARLWFAWIQDPDTPFDPAVHARLDEADLGFSMTHDEGKPAVASITFKNPGRGLFAPGRARFCLVSESADDKPASAVAFFRGRITTIPNKLSTPRLTVEAVAAPEDVADRLQAFCDANRRLPLDEPLLTQGDASPERFLEARSAFFHYDPVTWEISLSDVLEGDRLVDVAEHHSLKGFDPGFTDVPVRTARSRIVIEFEQAAAGPVELADTVGTVTSYGTNDSPVDFVGLDPGWTVRANRAKVQTLDRRQLPVGDLLRRSYVVMNKGQTVTFPDGRQFVAYQPTDETYALDGVLEAQVPRQEIGFETLQVGYDYRQPRREYLDVAVSIGLQEVGGLIEGYRYEDQRTADPAVDYGTPHWYPGMGLRRGDPVQYDGRTWAANKATVTSAFYRWDYVDGVLVNVSTPDFDEIASRAPLPDRRAPVFVGSGRGDLLVQHVALLLRAFLRYRSRCMSNGLKVSWPRARGVTPRYACRYMHPDGTFITGKVTSVTRSWNGKGWVAGIRVGSSVGDGSGMDVPLGNDVSYGTGHGVPVVPVNAFLLGLPAYAVADVRKANEADDQVRAVQAAAAADRAGSLANNPSTATVFMRELPTAPVLELAYATTATVLRSPRQYDTEA